MRSHDVKLDIAPGLVGTIWHYHNRGQMFPMHTHRELEFNLVVRGQGAYLLDDRRYEIGRNSLVWLFRGQPHLLLDLSADFEMWIVVWNPQLVRRHAPPELRRARPSGPPGASGIPGEFNRQTGEAPAGRLATLLEEIASSVDDPVRFNLGLAYLLRCAWAVHQASTLLTLGVEVHPAVDRAARAIGRDPTLELEAVARQASISGSRLRHLFRAQVGVSLVAYRNRRRLERFWRCFGDGRRVTMLQAALDAGFGSYVQFHRVFTRALGMSPRTWQSQRRRTAAE